MGAIGTRLSPRPLFSERATFVQTSGATCRENADAYPLRCLKIESKNKHRRRPGLEPGPITTNVDCCARLGPQSASTTHTCGYGSRRSPGRPELSHPKRLRVPRLDVLALRLHLGRIGFQQFQARQWHMPALLLDLRME